MTRTLFSCPSIPLFHLAFRFIVLRFIIPVSFLFFMLSSSAQPGSMLRFDGVDDYIELGNLLPHGSYTKECWISAGFYGASSSNLISGMRTGFWAPNGLLRAGHSTANGFSDVKVHDSMKMSINMWFHVAVTYDSKTNILSLYKDGVMVDQGPASGVYVETNLFIGTYNVTSQPQSLYEGRMDEVRIWNVVRTPEQIADSRFCRLSGDEPGLVAYYDFEQGIADNENGGETMLKDRTNQCLPKNGLLKNFALRGGGSNWSGPGVNTAAMCTPTYANVRVSGNGMCIIDNDQTPDLADHTSFNNETTRTFTIRNVGKRPLAIFSVALVAQGTQGISVTAQPGTTLAVGDSTTFTLTRSNAASTVATAMVHVNTDDPGEGDFNFLVSTKQVRVANIFTFTATKQGTAVRLDWTTNGESNSSQFRVMRSSNGNDWTQLGTVTAAGNSTADIDYFFIDQQPLQGANHYRLEIVAMDNSRTFSDIRTVLFGGQGGVRLYPVPAREKIVIEQQDNSLVGTTALFIDHQGRSVLRFVISSDRQEIQVGHLPAGAYILRLENGEAKRFLLQ